MVINGGKFRRLKSKNKKNTFFVLLTTRNQFVLLLYEYTSLNENLNIYHPILVLPSPEHWIFDFPPYTGKRRDLDDPRFV